MKWAVWLLLAVLSALAASAVAAEDDAALAAFKKAIRAKYDMKEQAFADHDPEPIVMKFYSEDVISVGEGEAMVRGRDELRKLYVEIVQNHPNRVQVESFATKVEGNLGWDWADFHVTPENTSVAPFTFKILFLWERRDGEWICTGDIFVVDKPRTVPEVS